MSSKVKYTADEQKQMKSLKSTATVHFSLLFALIGVIGYLLIADKLDFGGLQGIKAQSLTQLPARLQYVLRHATLGVLWLLFCFFYVGSQRSNTPAVDPSAGYEHLTQLSKNIFNNSIEQFLMSVFSQLILVTYLEPKVILNVIPIMSIMLFVGRILFWLGYPKKRSFGFGLGFLPTLIAILYITYKYVTIYV